MDDELHDGLRRAAFEGRVSMNDIALAALASSKEVKDAIAYNAQHKK